jgi:hypothetical protein
MDEDETIYNLVKCIYNVNETTSIVTSIIIEVDLKNVTSSQIVIYVEEAGAKAFVYIKIIHLKMKCYLNINL